MAKVIHSIDTVRGFQSTGVHAGLKKNGALDMALIVSDRDCAAGAVFTKNMLKAAPVLVNMGHLKESAERIRAVAINTVSANAGTGEQGLENSRQMAQIVADKIGCEAQQVFVMSTGVIGTHLPMDKIEHGIHLAHQKLGDHWADAAAGVMTTDVHRKYASLQQNGYTIAGITKGTGMIAPNMATMLGIIVTDAALTPNQAQQALSQASERSYNRIVIDGDTSTNDMVVLLANGASGVQISDDKLQEFVESLTDLTTYLAKQVVRDGEGATKFITIDVLNAPSEAAAAQIAHTIASSSLVKTAFYGNDANWGRILAAAGRAGVDFDANSVSLWMAAGEELQEGDCGLLLFQNGTKAQYDETEATAIISAESSYITLDLAVGDSCALVWTCDLSHEYVSINADYRT